MKNLPWQRNKFVRIDKEQAYDNLKLAQVVLDKLSIPFFLSSGTLLGLFRNGDFIDHDEDIDLGVFIEHYDTKIISSFKRKGFFLVKVFGHKEEGLEISFTRGGVKLDIFFYYKEHNTMWHAVWYVNKYINFRFLKNLGLVRPKLRKLSFPLFYSYSFIKFRDIKLPIPSNTEDYLIAQYGENWRIPDKNWDNFTSQKNYIS